RLRLLEFDGTGDARVVHEHVQAAERIDRRVDGALAGIDLGQVGLQGVGDATGMANVGHELCRAGLAVGIVHRDRGTLPCQLACDGGADAHAGSSDECELAFERTPRPRSDVAGLQAAHRGAAARAACRRCHSSLNRSKWISRRGCSRTTSRSSVTPRPGPVGSANAPSSTSGFPGAAALMNGSAKSLKCSRILKFGVTAAKCKHAAVETAPPTLW